MGWKPPEQRDSSYYLFEEKFLCTVPNLETMSVEYIEHFGIPTTGDPQWDRALATERVHRMLSINEMVEYHRRGVVVGICERDQTATIYQYVVDHLNAWKLKLDRDFNVGNAPVEDLMVLDQFAASVYKHARHEPLFNQQYVDSLFAREIGRSLAVTRDQIFKPLTPQVTVINGRTSEELAKEEEKLPEHTSMSDIFAGRLRVAQGGSKWK